MEHVLEDVCHLRNFKFTDKTPEKIYELNIRKRNLHCYDIETILKFKNLEKIHVVTDEEAFVDDFVKYVHLFDNLYEFTVGLQTDNKYKYIDLIKDNCYDTGKILFIKNLKKCSLVHNEDEKLECWECYTFERLSNTNSYICVIQNIEDNYLMNCLSYNIEKLTIVAKNLVNFDLSNLPCTIQNVTIIYDLNIEPSAFYELVKDNIKLPFECKLKIIKYFPYVYYYESSVDQSIKSRHFVIDN